MAELSFQLPEEFENEIRGIFKNAAREVLSEVSKQELSAKEYFTLKDAAEYIGVSFNTLRSWTRSKKFPLRTIQIGGKTFISKRTLIEFMNHHEK